MTATNTSTVIDNTDDLLASALAELDTLEGSEVAETTPVETVTTASDTAAFDDMDSLLAELEMPTPVVTETAALTDVTESELADLAAATAVADAKKEVYDAAEAGGMEEAVVVTEPGAVADAKKEAYDAAEAGGMGEEVAKAPKAKSRASGESKPSAALIARLGSVDAVYSQLIYSADDAKRTEADLAKECDLRLKSFDSLPKKIGEKAVNLVMHLAGSSTLSVYTDMALTMLFESGELDSKKLVERYMARPYSEGTSRSQAGQIMRLLQAFDIAEGTTSHLTLKKGSIIGQALAETIKKAA